MTADPWDAADVTQETFIKALTGLEHFRGNARFSTWIHRIAVNVVYDHLRRRRAEPLDDEALDRLAAQGGSQGQDPVSDGLSDDVREALLSLDDGFRLAVVLCDLLGFSYAEAAVILDVQEGTVKSRLFRARAMLGRRLSAAEGPARNRTALPGVPEKEPSSETR
jgi:RNA polymerase sigma-70 factor (ECF subfamily)